MPGCRCLDGDMKMVNDGVGVFLLGEGLLHGVYLHGKHNTRRRKVTGTDRVNAIID